MFVYIVTLALRTDYGTDDGYTRTWRMGGGHGYVEIGRMLGIRQSVC